MLDAALEWSRRRGLKLDTVHDALQLVQRCSAITSPGGGGGGGGGAGGAGGAPGGAGGAAGGGAALLATPMWRLTLAACLMLAARQGERPASLPGYDAVALATGERERAQPNNMSAPTPTDPCLPHQPPQLYLNPTQPQYHDHPPRQPDPRLPV
jgi:hypothetical protein